MHINSMTKSVVSIMATGATNGETLTANIDTLGFDSAAIDLIMGTSNTTSNKPSVLKLGESDDTVVSNFADITAFTGGSGFTIVTSSTSVENVYRFNVDCRNRKRYLRITVSPRTTQAVVLNARLGRAEQSGDGSTSYSGTQQVVSG